MRRSLRWIGLALLAGTFVVVAGCNLFNAAPDAAFSWSPLEPLARSEVEFEDESTDEGGLFGGGAVVSWDWDFDDGDSASSKNATHEFDKSGDYDVTLTVTDAGGKSTAVQKTVEVTPSLDGTWQGQIIDPNSNVVDFRLVLQHSATGGITGDAYMLVQRYSCSGVSFNPNTKTLRFELLELGIRLEGTMDASETRIEGDWYTLNNVQWWSWDVSLQD
jgi:PKD repeat protein